MASIERTAYPRFKPSPLPSELRQLYTPTPAECSFARAWARGPAPTLALLVLLKSFQRLGYFPSVGEVPTAIVDHIRASLDLAREVEPWVTPRTLYRYHQAIRDHLRIRSDGPEARHLAARAIAQAAEVKDNPADLVNVAIEELVRHRFELPAFSALDRLTRRIRTAVNRRIFEAVERRLTVADRKVLDALLLVLPSRTRSVYARLKAPAKRPTLGHLQELLDQLEMLETLGRPSGLLAGIRPGKIAHFAAEANSLDAAELADYAPAKRYTLLLCLIHRAQARVRDDLAEMFVKRTAIFHKRGREELEQLRARHGEKTAELVSVLSQVLVALDGDQPEDETLSAIRTIVDPQGGARQLLDDCEAVIASIGNNHLPLLWRFYRSHRRTLFRLLEAIELKAASQDVSLVRALGVLRANERSRGEWIDGDVDVSFAPEAWQRVVVETADGERRLNRRHFEVCVFSCLAAELKSGDVAIEGSSEYADYREQMIAWDECRPLVGNYCAEVGLSATAEAFVEELKERLASTAREVDERYASNSQLSINERGEPTLQRIERRLVPASALALERAVLERLPERSLLEVLCNVEHWTGWARHFGPLSGSDPKLERPRERYVLTTFTYGCNLGSSQAARHMAGHVTAHQLSFVNRRHVTATALDAAIRDILDAFSRLGLPKLWGDGTRAAADGTKYRLYEENLLSEYHIRYGGYGGIAYHHVADSYVALFSHFIPCGVWEAIYIIEGLLRNTSEIQPRTVHADTQGQSAPVFALAYLLGFNLMPRIRNWKEIVFYRPDRSASYEHIDGLFRETVDWGKIQTHWQDLIQVALSIRAGKVSSPTLLRKLGNYSRKNRLYQAFRELGRVVRTIFLLRYISDLELREQILTATNKVEAYNGFAKWFFFGGEGVITENEPDEQEKRIKYNDLVANAAVFQTTVDLTTVLAELSSEGYPVRPEDVALLSPYITRSIKRFGDYVIDLRKSPGPLSAAMELPFGSRKPLAKRATRR